MWPFVRKNRQIQGRGTLGLINLPVEVDDNLYLGAASKAAFADKESGAYDEFLFTEDSRKKMPFERALERHTELISTRLEEQGRREILARNRLVLNCESKISQLATYLRQLRDRKDITDRDIALQAEILHGHVKGNHEVFWTDSIPHMSSVIGTRIRLIAPTLTFLFVGLVDIGIIYLSFNHLPGMNGLDPIIFAVPAVGIQLVFPHLIGERIGLTLRGHEKKRQNVYESLFLGIGWLTFCFGMAVIRLQYMVSGAGVNKKDMHLAHDMRGPMAAVTLLMLIGLGSWLMLAGSRRNPHKTEMLRLLVRRHTLTKVIAKSEINLLATQGELPPLEDALNTVKESYADAVAIASAELADAARMVYRRSLINGMGDVDFTASYMGADDEEVDKSDDDDEPPQRSGALV